MCLKKCCAFLNAKGECMMTHAPCDGVGVCQMGVMPARKHGYSGSYFKEHYDLSTASGRFKFLTRSARGSSVYKTCKRKNRYASEYEARRIARLRTATSGTPLRVYECPYCHGYHMTSRAEVAA